MQYTGILRCEHWDGKRPPIPLTCCHHLWHTQLSHLFVARCTTWTFGPGPFLGSSLQDIHLAILIVGSFPNTATVIPGFNSSGHPSFSRHARGLTRRVAGTSLNC
ncbi:hypothetical protein CGRA01v4_08010 [Colletotrichum graminicola]|nr:hypothetical protein CGRA01v4_08010 [Colletotrichum graminicola]